MFYPSFFLIFTLAVLFPVFGRHVDGVHNVQIPGELFNSEIPVCRTQACYKAALTLWQSVNTSVDPCDDFYEFACGKWISNNPVPATQRHWNRFDVLTQEMDRKIVRLIQQPAEDDLQAVKNVKTIYGACMNQEDREEKGLKPLVDLLNILHGWPMAGWNMTSQVWYLLVAKTTRLIDVSPLIEVSVSVDKKNTSNRIITIDQPLLTLPRYELADGVSDILQSYKEYVADTAAHVAKTYGHVLPRAAFNMEADALVRFERKLALITKKGESRRDLNTMYHKVTVSRLQDVTNSVPVINRVRRIQWRAFLKGVFEDFAGEITDETEIVVRDLHYLYHLLMLVDATSPRVVVNYINWRVVQTMIRDLNQEMQDTSFRFDQVALQVTADEPKWRECLDNAGYLTFAIGYMYVYSHFSHAGKEKAISMVAGIKQAFRKELSEVNWMDETTKQAAAEKADYMNNFMGYPPWYANESALELFYDGLKLGEDHFENMLRVRKFLIRKNFEKLRRPTDRNEWLFEPAVVNAFYSPDLNSIIFPAGILQPPFFSDEQPDALNYGSIGVIIGHEISHGFDDTGRQGDKLGNVNQWWTKETEQTYLKKAQCFIEQYSQYRIPQLDQILRKKMTINGRMTLGENIADNGGLRAAFRAYKESSDLEKEARLPNWQHLTPEQLFFLGFANVWCEATTDRSLLSEVLDDSHSPHKFRVIGTLSNSPEFSKAWHCPTGSSMNPRHKCKLW